MKELATLTCRGASGALLRFTLADRDGVWQGEGEGAADLARTLSLLFGLRRLSPADGQPGARQAHAAAQWLKENVGMETLSVGLPRVEPAPPKAVY